MSNLDPGACLRDRRNALILDMNLSAQVRSLVVLLQTLFVVLRLEFVAPVGLNVGRLDLRHAVRQAANCVGMGAVILAKHAAQDRRDAVLGPAAVLDAASQARHAVAATTAVRQVQHAVVTYAVWLDILVVEATTAVRRVRHAVAATPVVRQVQRAVVAYAVWLDILVVEVLTAAHRVRRATVKLASVFIPRRLCQQLLRRLLRVWK